MLYTLNLHTVTCQLYLNKAGEKLKTKQKEENDIATWCVEDMVNEREMETLRGSGRSCRDWMITGPVRLGGLGDTRLEIGASLLCKTCHLCVARPTEQLRAASRPASNSLRQ